MGKTKPKERRRPKRLRAADRADLYDLYLKSVQAPDVDVAFFSRVYKSHYGVAPRVLREDFCGTAAVCCEWVKRNKENVAYGVDLDPEPLAWGREHILSKLGPSRRERVHLVQADVRTAKTPKVDVIAAQNFSYCVFKTRDELRGYFRAARAHLAKEGVFILDLFGGPDSIEDEREEATEIDGFDYVWEQHRFDPINNFGTYKIHFHFHDGSKIRDAFSYEWRLWTIPEVREVLIEAGFSKAEVYWEDTDPKTGEGNGYYRRRATGECDPAWNAYIIGVK